MIAALGGCARYQPRRLTTELHPAVPDMRLLSVEAAKIDRPFLTPQPIDLAAPLSPNAIAVIAVLENPDLKAFRARNLVSSAQVFGARLLPDPTTQLGFDKRISGPDKLNGFADQIGFDLQALRTRRVIAQAGRAIGMQVRLDLAWAEWQMTGTARLRAARILTLEPILALVREGAASTADLLNRSSARPASALPLPPMIAPTVR